MVDVVDRVDTTSQVNLFGVHVVHEVHAVHHIEKRLQSWLSNLGGTMPLRSTDLHVFS